MRDLLGRIARGESALGAACIAGLLACGLILIAALTLDNAQVDRWTEAAERDGRPFLRIAVQDSGHGIAPELLPQLFVSFVTTKLRGTGLGLRICRRIIAGGLT